MTHDLMKKAGKGIAWNFSSQVIQQIIQFFVVVVLARLLTPADFGIFGMAVVFSNLLQPFRQWGFQAFLIQKKDMDGEYENTAFWSICAVGLALFIIVIAASPYVGIFFNDVKVGHIVGVLSIGFLFSPIGSIQWAMVNRELNFRVIAIRDIIVTIIYGISVTIFALAGLGVWALVIAALLRELAWSVVFLLLYKWRPSFSFNVKKFKEMLSFGMNCIGSGVLGYAASNVDNILVGKFLGPANLGFYNLAFNTVSKPETKIVTHISSVAFPVFSLIQDEKKRIRETYLKTLRLILLVVVPLLSILFISARDFVLVLYGSKWLLAVAPIQIMCLYGLFTALTSIAGPVFWSKGRSDIMLWIGILKIIVLLLFLTVGLRYGIIGVSIAILFYSLVIFFPVFYLANKFIELKNADFFRIVIKYLLLYILIASAVWVIDFFFIQKATIVPFFHLIATLTAGFFTYFLLLLIFYREDAMLFINVIKNTFS